MLLLALDALKELISYYPFALPAIIISYVHSCACLQIWKASRRLPFYKASSDENEESRPQSLNDLNWIKKEQSRPLLYKIGISFYLPLLMLPTFQVGLLNDPVWVRAFYVLMLVIPFTAAISETMAILFGFSQLIVTRDSKGKLSLSKEDKRASHIKFLFATFGTLVTVAAIWYELGPAILLVLASMLLLIPMAYNIAITTLIPQTAFRVLVAAAGTIYLSLAGLAIVLAIGLQLFALPQIIRLQDCIRWYTFISNTIFLILPFNIISMLLRFDYTNSLTEDRRAQVSKSTTGFRIDILKMGTFPRPYFTTALIALCGTFIAIAVHSLSGSGEDKYTLSDAALCVALLSAPAMFCGTFLVAAIKGQVGKLWRYSEDWGYIPSVNQEVSTDDDPTSVLKARDETKAAGLIPLEVVGEDAA